MKRGEIWTMAGGPGYASKPRPVVIIQDDAFDETASIIVCLVTSEAIQAPILRLPVEPTSDNGLHQTSDLMVDKVVTVPRAGSGSGSASSAMTTCCVSTDPCWCFWVWRGELTHGVPTPSSFVAPLAAASCLSSATSPH